MGQFVFFLLAASVLTVAIAPLGLSYGAAALFGMSAASGLVWLYRILRPRKDPRTVAATSPAPGETSWSPEGYLVIPQAAARDASKRHLRPSLEPIFNGASLSRVARTGLRSALSQPAVAQVQTGRTDHAAHCRIKVLVCAFEPRFSALAEADADAYRAFWPSTTRACFSGADPFLDALAQGFDVVHLLGEVGDDQRIRGFGHNGETLLTHCADAGVKLVWMASDNAPQVYIEGFHTRGRPINLIMTLQRHGPVFGAFLKKLLAGVSSGEELGLTWVRLCPQGAPMPSAPDAPATIFVMGAPDWPGRLDSRG